jgi:hypothetical protein
MLVYESCGLHVLCQVCENVLSQLLVDYVMTNGQLSVLISAV